MTAQKHIVLTADDGPGTPNPPPPPCSKCGRSPCVCKKEQ